MSLTLPEKYNLVNLYQGAANAVASDVVSCKNAHKVWFVVTHKGAADTDLVLSLYESTDVAAGTNAAVTTACPIWADTNAGTSSDTLARQTDAYTYTIDTGNYPNQVVVIEWDPAKHTDGYDCIYLSDSGGNASNTCSIMAVIENRYPQQTLPTAITD